MEYAESLERAHRTNCRATNIYVEHPHRSGSAVQPPSDPGPTRKGIANSPANGRVFTTDIGIRQIPEDQALKAFVVFSPPSSSSSQRPTDFRCTAQTICYQRPLQYRETLPLQTEGGLLQLSTPNCSPSVYEACCRAPHDALQRHEHPTTVATKLLLQPSLEGLPSRTNDKPIGYRTPIVRGQGQQGRRPDFDAGGAASQKSHGLCEEVCPRCGKLRGGGGGGEVDVEWMEEGRAAAAAGGYGTSRVLDAVSCLCCVKAVFYHCCSDEDDETHCSDAPCSCTGSPLCCPRWTCLLLAGVTCLPCLLLYWPIRILLRLVAGCRRLCAGNGCSCAKAKEGYDACAFRKF